MQPRELAKLGPLERSRHASWVEVRGGLQDSVAQHGLGPQGIRGPDQVDGDVNHSTWFPDRQGGLPTPLPGSLIDIWNQPASLGSLAQSFVDGGAGKARALGQARWAVGALAPLHGLKAQTDPEELRRRREFP